MATFTRANGVLAEVLDDRAVLVTVDGREVITLNPVGTLVWQALDDTHDLEGLVRVVGDKFPTTAGDVVRADVESFLGVLREAGLVDTVES